MKVRDHLINLRQLGYQRMVTFILKLMRTGQESEN